MKLALTLAAIVALSLTAGVSHATPNNDNGCKKSGNSYVCDPGDGDTYTFGSATSEADASAKLDAYLANISNNTNLNSNVAQGGAGGDGGNAGAIAGSNATGGNAIINEAKQPKWTGQVTIGAVFDAAELLDGPNKRANRTAMSYGALGDNGSGLAVLDSTHWGRKAQKKIEESGGALCQMTKDGVLQVNRYTNIAQCKAYHGVK